MKKLALVMCIMVLVGLWGCSATAEGDGRAAETAQVVNYAELSNGDEADSLPADEANLQYEVLGTAVDNLRLPYLVVKIWNVADQTLPSVRAQCLFRNDGALVSEYSLETEIVGEAIVAFPTPDEYDEYEVRLKEGENFFHRDVKDKVRVEATRDYRGDFLLTLQGKAETCDLVILCYAGGELVGISQCTSYALDGEQIKTVYAPNVEFDDFEVFLNYAIE